MSAQTWKDEFYPVEAIAAVGSWQEAAEHSLRKWSGMRSENLEKHDLLLAPIELNGETCALCCKDNTGDGCCSDCVLAAVHDGVACYCRTDDENDNDSYSPFDSATMGAPGPLIELLEKAVEYAKERGI